MSDTSIAKLFVGRLPEGCTEKDLEDLFCTYGAVKQTDLVGKYGFVHFTKREEAEEALKKLNNYNFMGSQLTVQFSTSKMSNTSGKSKTFMNNANRRPKRPSGPNRNFSSPGSRGQSYNRFAGPAPIPPNNFGPYYDDMNPYYREPYYPESEPFYGQTGNNMHSAPAYDNQFGRRGPPPPTANYTRPPVPPPVQTDYYNRGDGPYNRPLGYDLNQPIVQNDPSVGMAYGGPVRNGYGNTGYPNRGAAGLAGNRVGAVPQPQPTARWQPY